jgi:protein SCO1/2
MAQATLPAKRAQHAFALMLVATLLFGFGTVMSFFGATYTQEIGLLGDVPAALWNAICGQPLPSVMTAPVMFSAGILAALAGGALLLRGASRMRVVIVAVMLLSVFGAAFAGYLYGHLDSANNTPPPAIARVQPPRTMPNFTLTSQNGQPMQLSDLRGRTVLMFFGYTHCPDICPTSLSDMKRIKAALGDDAKDVAFVFVSVDGARDTPALLKQYVTLFDPSFIGLTGTEAEVRQIALEYGAHFTYDKSASETAYVVNHTADTYVLDKGGQWQAAYALNTLVEDVVKLVKQVIAETR